MTTPRLLIVLPDGLDGPEAARAHEAMAQLVGEAAARHGVRWRCEHGHDVPFGVAECPTCGTRRFEVFRA